MEIFIKIPSTVIPPKSKRTFNLHNNISDWYFANCKTVGDDICKSIVYYDFSLDKWGIVTAGKTEVVEYYIRDERFEYWMQKVNKIDIELMYELFNAMDDEDKVIPYW